MKSNHKKQAELHPDSPCRRTTGLRRYFLSLTLLPLLWISGSNAAEQEEWIYTLVPGDNPWNITERYLDQGMRHWLPLVRHNEVEDPHHMPPGSKLRIPMKWLKVDPATVQVRDVHGGVEYIAAQQTSPRPLAAGTVLKTGDRVIVGSNADAILEFADQTRLFLGSGSELELTRVKKFSDSGLADSKVDLRSGRTENKVRSKNTRFQIKTPSANTAVRGTDFRVAVDQHNPTVSRVEVLSGTVGVTGGGGEKKIKAGYGTAVAEGEAPAAPVKLLPSPGIQSPADYSRKLPVDIKWQKVSGAERYRVQVRRLEEGKQTLVLDQVTGYPRISTSALADGNYLIRVRAIDGSGLEGREAEHALQLDARPQPPLAISPRADETVRTDLPQFEWSSPEGGTAYHFQLSDKPDLSSPLVDGSGFSGTRYTPEQLAPGTYYWRMATRAAGEEGPFGQIHSFTLRPTPDAPEVSAEGDGENITLRWQPGTEGQQYEAQLSEDPKFREVLREEQLQQAGWTLERPSHLAYFRVRVIDVDGFAGDWSITQQIVPPPDPWYYTVIPVAIIILLAL